MYGSTLQGYFLNVDTSTTHQITTAPTMKQAEEVMSPLRTAITRSRGPLFQFLTEGSLQNTTGSKANRTKLASTKKGVENFLTGSLLEVRPMSINKLQGLQIKVATVDEWLSGDIREDVIGAIEQGASKVNDYIIVAISSEGTVRNGSGDTIKMELMDILKGDYINPHVSIWWYKLDSIDEVGDPEMWLKANPNLGKTVSYETYQLDVERAEKAPAARNDILAKRFGLPMEGYTYYFTYEETLPHRKRDYWQMLNYNNRTIEPIISAIVDEMKRKFLTKTARSQHQSISFFRDPFKLVPVNDIAEIADKFTRNEIMTSNEIRQVVGMKPSEDPRADELRNKNLSAPSGSDQQSEEMPIAEVNSVEESASDLDDKISKQKSKK